MKHFLFLLICSLATFSVLGCGSDKRDEAYAKACSANMRIMTGCIEMYNMDHAEMMKEPKENMFFQADGIMIKTKLLKQPLQKPTEKCAYSFSGDFSEVDKGVIRCAVHGTIAEIGQKYKK